MRSNYLLYSLSLLSAHRHYYSAAAFRSINRTPVLLASANTRFDVLVVTNHHPTQQGDVVPLASSCNIMQGDNESEPPQNQSRKQQQQQLVNNAKPLLMPRKSLPKRGVLSKLTTSQLAALVERQQHKNKAGGDVTTKKFREESRTLLKMGFTLLSAFVVTFAKSTVARAAAAAVAVVATTSNDPSMYYHIASTTPGLGVVQLPSQIYTMLNTIALSFALAGLFGWWATWAMFASRSLSDMEEEEGEEEGGYYDVETISWSHDIKKETSSSDGWHVRFMHFMTRSLTDTMKEEGNENDTTVELDTRTMLFVPKKDGEEIELGLPKETNWDDYSRSSLDPLQRKKDDECKKPMYDFGGHGMFDEHTMLFEQVRAEIQAEHDEELHKLKRATKYFQEQQYKQHHRPVHVARSTKLERSSSSYLGNLPINAEEKHDMPKSYLDTLSDAKMSTWDVYKQTLNEGKLGSEVDELKHQISALQNLVQIEQSMYQTSNRALKLAMEAQTDELHHSSAKDEIQAFDQKLSTSEELKEFDRKARQYEDTVVKEMDHMSRSVGDESKATYLYGCN